MVFKARAERMSVMYFPVSGIKIFRVWRLAFRRTLPQGLNCVARVRFEYLPPTRVDLPVTAHCLAIVVAGYHSPSLTSSGTVYSSSRIASSKNPPHIYWTAFFKSAASSAEPVCRIASGVLSPNAGSGVRNHTFSVFAS